MKGGGNIITNSISCPPSKRTLSKTKWCDRGKRNPNPACETTANRMRKGWHAWMIPESTDPDVRRTYKNNIDEACANEMLEESIVTNQATKSQES